MSCCKGHNTKLLSNKIISKKVRVNIAFTATFFKEYSINFLMISKLTLHLWFSSYGCLKFVELLESQKSSFSFLPGVNRIIDLALLVHMILDVIDVHRTSVIYFVTMCLDLHLPSNCLFSRLTGLSNLRIKHKNVSLNNVSWHYLKWWKDLTLIVKLSLLFFQINHELQMSWYCASDYKI